MNKPKVAFFSAKSYEIEYFDLLNKQFQFDIAYFESNLNTETAKKAGCSVISVFVNDNLDEKMMIELHKLGVKLVALRGTGYDNIDLKAASGKLRVVRVPDYSPYAVAEYAVGLMLCLNRKIHKAYERTCHNNFDISGFLGFDMHGKTAGVVGTGKIGKAVIQILKGFGMKVLAFDIDEAQVKKTDAEFATLTRIYKESDIITLHPASSSENYHMIDKAAIEQMKPGVMIINTGRGKLIDTKALIEGLKNKKIGSAGLDVYENEKEFFYKDLSQSGMDDEVLSTLQKLPNVLLTSHQAFFTKEALHNIALTTLNNIREFFDGKQLANEIKDVRS
jgi:D-lactate dehydrogenase